DPNRAGPDEIADAVRTSLDPAVRLRAARLGDELRRDPGAERAARLLVRQAERLSTGAGCLAKR
ncbi:MAG TPA: hypothetical protein VHH55_05335, partial [Gaiellaceae bacterium]|nr:hypothetical protein [Gaiellaceae bacterium]